jgi:hypothetical protein
MASCVVYLVAPTPQAPVHPADIGFILAAAATGRPVLVAINGPPRGTDGRPLSSAVSAITASANTMLAGGVLGPDGQQAGPRMTPQQQAEVVGAWRAALDRECQAAGVDSGRVALLVTDLLQEGYTGDASGVGGVHGYEEVSPVPSGVLLVSPVSWRHWCQCEAVPIVVCLFCMCCVFKQTLETIAGVMHTADIIKSHNHSGKREANKSIHASDACSPIGMRRLTPVGCCP